MSIPMTGTMSTEGYAQIARENLMWWHPTTIEVSDAFDLWPAKAWYVYMDRMGSSPAEYARLTVYWDPDAEVCGERRPEMYWECRMIPGHDCPHMPFSKELLHATPEIVARSVACWRAR